MTQTTKKQIFKGLKWAALTLGLLSVLILLALVALQLPAVQERVSQRVTHNVAHLAANTLSTAEVTGIQGRFPFGLEIERIALHDARGPWLEISNLVIKSAPWGLLKDDLHLQQVTASQVHLHRLPPPQTAGSPKASPGITLPVDLPRVTLDNFEIRKLKLEAPLLGTTVAFNLTGRIVAPQKGRDLNLRLRLEQMDQERPTFLEVASGWRKTPGMLLDMGIDLDLQLGAGGFFAQRLGFPQGGRFQTHLQSRENPAQWHGQVDLKLPDKGAVAGPLDIDLAQRILSVEQMAVVVAPGVVPETVRHLVGADYPLRVSARYRFREQALDVTGVIQKGVDYGLQVRGGIDFATRQIDAQGVLNLDSTTVLKPWVGDALDGAGALSMRVSGALSRPGVVAELRSDQLTTPQAVLNDLAVTAVLAVPAPPNSEVGASTVYILKMDGAVGTMNRRDGRPLQETPTELGLTGHLADNGSFIVDALQLSSASDRIAYTGRFDTGRLQGQGEFDAALENIAPYAAIFGFDWRGSLTAETSVSGDGAGFAAQGQLQTGPLTMDGQHLAPLKLVFDVTMQEKVLNGHSQVEWGLEKSRLVAKTDFSFNRGVLGLSGTRVSGNGLSMTGKAQVNLNTKATQAQAQGSIASLVPIGELMGLDLAGNMRFKTGLQTHGDQRHLSLELAGNHIQSPWVNVDDVHLRAKLSDDAKAPEGNATLALEGVNAGRFDFEKIDGTVRGNLTRATFELAAKGQKPIAVDLSLAGTYQRQSEKALVSISALQGDVDRRPVALNAPLILGRDSRGWQVELPGLTCGDAKLAVAARLVSDGIDLQADLDGLPLDLSARLGGPSLQGTARAHLRLQGPLNQPTGLLKFAGQDLQLMLEDYDPLPPVQVHLDARLSPSLLDFNLHLKGLDPKPTQAAVSVPVQISLWPLRLDLEPQAPLEGKVDGYLDLASIAYLVPMDGHEVGGLLQAHLQVGGVWTEPRINGQLALGEGLYENLRSGTVLKNIRLKVDARHEKLIISELSAQDVKGGKVSATGSVTLDSAHGHPLQLEISFERAHLLDRVDMSAVIDGALKVSGSLQNMLCSGVLTARPVVVQIGNSGQISTEALEVTEVNLPQAASAPTLSAKQNPKPPLDPTLDLTLRIEDQLFVRGRGLDSTWGGTLHVLGSVSEPLIEGDLNIVRGHFDLFSKRFQLAQGSVGFQGETPPDPYLDILATASNGGINGRLALKGRAKTLKIEISSEEGLPQDEVLSRLLFGEDATNISALQALQLANALRVLTGIGSSSSPDLVGRFQKWLHVDQLDFKSDENGGTTLGIGKYLTEDVYLNYEQGIGSRNGKISTEIKVSPKLSLETELGLDSQSGVGVNWNHDY